MIPGDLELIRADAAQLERRADRFTAEFYATLFDLDPTLRRLFPDDLTQQRRKLLAEITVLVERATAAESPTAVDELADHARALGSRHEVYGVDAPMYGTVEVALLAALDETVDGFDDAHHGAWSRLYRMVAAAMHGH